MTTCPPKASATIAAIRKYSDMRLITVNTPDNIKDRYDALACPRSPCLDGMPRTQNVHAGEEYLADTLDLIAKMRERYKTAITFLLWFEPMWLALTDSERRILETYNYNDIRAGIAGEAVEEASYSTRQLHRARQKALSRLEFLLYGE